ncbi:MAG: phosphoglucosamine mutase [Rhodospirillaceae bacterium TMED8]|nr:phosphoglucosamine mutase [Magnetovibrio sp.]OUT50225.1 MAG: phosphoglucosamine mutase [Rhodospirillaceae bacterium TMED8]
MTAKYFGTDGIRGRANTEPMSADTALRIGMAAGSHFIKGDHRHRVVIGKDTRLSGYMLEPALQAGFVSVGMDVILVGPMPTPAIAMLTRSLRADLGVMLSASHNPYHDNGIKFFGPDGFKLSDEAEVAIEARLDRGINDLRAGPDKLGRARRLDDVVGRYTEFVKQTFPRGLSLDGLKVVIDCANGAAYKVAPEVLWELGADVIPVGVSPNGFNINKDCGSTETGYLSEQITTHGADIGLALDGDADRLIVVDETGLVIDGDQIMAVIAERWAKTGDLNGNGVVATVMSNKGFENYLASKGLNLIRTQVGDRYVVERMQTDGYNVGGEQSGHIILGDFATTGDGLIAGLQILASLAQEGRLASEICRRFEPYPQRTESVRFSGVCPMDVSVLRDAIRQGEAQLGEVGRVLIRKSGTEPVIRIMAEGEDEGLVSDVVTDIAEVLRQVVDG